MNPFPRSIILGTNQRKDSCLTLLALVLGGFVLTFGGYALGVFSVSGGALLIPFYAAIVGVLAAFWVGYAKSGLLFAWLVTYAPMLGFHVEDALLGAREQSIGERVTYLVQLDAFVVLGVEAIIFGTVAFAVGYLLRGGSTYSKSVHNLHHLGSGIKQYAHLLNGCFTLYRLVYPLY